MSEGASDAAAEIVIEKKPEALARKGLLGATTAPAGRPETVISSLAPAVPQMRAGVEPADHVSLDASTMCGAKTQPSGPHLDGHAPLAAGRRRHSAERRCMKDFDMVELCDANTSLNTSGELT